ncbi:hypothetical protein PTKU46_97270 [Paraburkholderia terrae]
MQQNPGTVQRRDRTEGKVRGVRSQRGKPQFREKKPTMAVHYDRAKTSVALAVQIGGSRAPAARSP